MIDSTAEWLATPSGFGLHQNGSAQSGNSGFHAADADAEPMHRCHGKSNTIIFDVNAEPIRLVQFHPDQNPARIAVFDNVGERPLDHRLLQGGRLAFSFSGSPILTSNSSNKLANRRRSGVKHSNGVAGVVAELVAAISMSW